MNDSKEKKIVINKDGPYVVSGEVPLTVEIITNNKEGFSWDWKQGKTFEKNQSIIYVAADIPKTNHSVMAHMQK